MVASPHVSAKSREKPKLSTTTWQMECPNTTARMVLPSSNEFTMGKNLATRLCHSGLPQQTRQLGFHGNGTNEDPPTITKLEKATIGCRGNKIILMGRDTCNHQMTGIDPCYQLRSTSFLRQWILEVNLEGAQRVM